MDITKVLSFGESRTMWVLGGRGRGTPEEGRLASSPLIDHNFWRNLAPRRGGAYGGSLKKAIFQLKIPNLCNKCTYFCCKSVEKLGCQQECIVMSRLSRTVILKVDK